MKPLSFPQQTKTLSAPLQDVGEPVDPLPVWTNGREVISCWQPTWRERWSLLVFGRLWVRLLTGAPTQCPIALQASRTIFATPKP